jgi:hypothetical protein
LTTHQAVDRWAGPRPDQPLTVSGPATSTMESEPVITELADISVAVVGYHEPDHGPADHGPVNSAPADRVDIIDRRRLVEVASLTRADAVRLADRLCDAASSNDQPVMAKLIRDAAVEAVDDAAAALQGHDVRAAADFDLLVAEIAVAALNAAAARLRELGADPDSEEHRRSATPPPADQGAR